MNGAMSPLGATARGLAIVAATAAIQWWLGRSWWCETGDLNPWSSDTFTAHNSQHLFDPYTFTHVLHGLAFYAILWWLVGARRNVATRGVITVGLEAAWELFENTSFVIERYRSETISLGYFGDSIANSIGDIAACAFGYLIAASVPVWGSVALFSTSELLLLWWIRDSLILNVVMLLWSFEWLKEWQGGGGPLP